jgi:hypothetical protein
VNCTTVDGDRIADAAFQHKALAAADGSFHTIAMIRGLGEPVARVLLAFVFFCGPRGLPAVFAQAENQAANTQMAGTESHPAELHPVLLELFTSEGCSSCPPADGLLQKLDIHQPIPGVQLIVLSEHVDYWDHDGWKDPNSSAQLTERQTSYEEKLGEKTPYTPQMIADGTTIVQISKPDSVKQALEKAATSSKIAVRIGDVTIDAGNPAVLRAHIETDANVDNRNADVYVVAALDHVESQVLKGENGGKHLTHVAVAQEFKKIGKIEKGKTFSQEVELKLKPGTDPKNVRLIAFIQEPGPGKLLGVALRKPTS